MVPSTLLGLAFLHIVFKICICGTWFSCELSGISGFLWGKIYLLHWHVPLLKAAGVCLDFLLV